MRDALIARMRFYADEELHVTRRKFHISIESGTGRRVLGKVDGIRRRRNVGVYTACVARCPPVVEEAEECAYMVRPQKEAERKLRVFSVA